MILIRRYTLIPLFALLAALFTGCSDRVEPEMAKMVTLRLVVDTGAQSSRAAEAPDYFEKPSGDFENISTLRVILINDKNLIEDNKIVRTAATGAPLYDNLEFKTPSGNKQVYLIANEASLTVPDAFRDKYSSVTAFLDDVYKSETLFSSYTFDEWRVTLPTDYDEQAVQNVTRSLFADNPDAVGVPLTESFRFNVAGSADTQQYDQTQTVQLFLTRAAAKVSYNVVVDEDYKASGVNITGIKLNGLNVAQYVFPRKAVYSIKNSEGEVENIDKEAIIYPGLPKPVNAVNRFITSFETPGRYFSGAGASMVMNLSPQDYVEIAPKTNATRGPVYITESLMPDATSRFTVQVELDGNGNWLDAKPLGVGTDHDVVNNILLVNGKQAIARNTHLIVQIHFSEVEIFWQAVVAPYNELSLNPEFGL